MKKLHTLVPAFAFITLILFVATAARPGPGDEHLVTVINKLQEEPIITTQEVVDIIVNLNSKTDEQVVLLPSHSHDNNNKLSHDCDDTKNKGFSDDFEPRPNVSAYGGDNKLVETKTKYADDFEPRPNVSAYGGDDDKSVENQKKYANDFEPRPNVSAYGGDDN